MISCHNVVGMGSLADRAATSALVLAAFPEMFVSGINYGIARSVTMKRDIRI